VGIGDVDTAVTGVLVAGESAPGLALTEEVVAGAEPDGDEAVAESSGTAGEVEELPAPPIVSPSDDTPATPASSPATPGVAQAAAVIAVARTSAVRIRIRRGRALRTRPR
jgi:hypothetical protein